MEGDEDDGPEMDDLEEEFPAAKSPSKKPHEPVAFDVYSENGEHPPQRRPGEERRTATGAAGRPPRRRA